MLQYPTIDPIAFTVGPLQILNKSFGPFHVYWYGTMYLCAFIFAWVLAWWRTEKAVIGEKLTGKVMRDDVENLILYAAFGVILGGRLGYMIFYSFIEWMSDPFMVFRVWEGGMSFHGGLIGVLVALTIYSSRIKVRFLMLSDFVAPLVPIGLLFGRVGNFIGQELWGRVSDVPWAMHFPNAGDAPDVGRHPSQLYEATLEGLVLFIILNWFVLKPRSTGSVSALFLILYASFRSFCEIFREPDKLIGFDLWGVFTRGQLLCLPMFIAGVAIMVYASRNETKN